MHFVIPVLLSGLLVGTDDKSGAKKEVDALAGMWEVVSVTVDGKKLERAKDAIEMYTFKADGKLTTAALNIGDDKRSFDYIFKIVGTKEPKEIDLDLIVEGKAQNSPTKGIYVIKGNELKLCMTQEENAPRPKAFVTKEGSNTICYVMKRSK
jgi:uncharacterized protein (TIGR03067 family)